ncbi:MAG: STAS domain-containing protein, partial [Planctomycetota bacterium]
MQKFEFQTKVIDKTAQVTIVGEVTAGNASQFKQQLMQAILLDTPTILLDLSNVKRMDSAGVAVLIE